jgi:PAS domain S-box-containing protein
MAKVNQRRDLVKENELLRLQLMEANDTIEAIRNGEIDALVVEGKNGHELYTLTSADRTYRNFIEQMSEGALTLNSEGIIVYCNSSFAAILGASAKDVVSRGLADFVPEALQKDYEDFISVGWQRETKGEICLKGSTREIPVQLSVAPLKMEDGMALSVIVTDLTSQKEIQNALKSNNEQLETINKQLELSNHDLQQFASVASHDLQEPLRKIQVFSHLLKDKYSHELSEISGNYLGKIVHAANRMKVLIVDILNYSRLSSNDYNYVKTDLSAMINELLTDLELTIKEKDASIRVTKMPEMEINPGQMRQVFQNLISNALKFCKRGVPPVIEIYCEQLTQTHPVFRQDVPYCNIHIKDNGIGFDERFSKSIFNLFEKLHSKDDYDGSGIGLAITKKIIEKHHGQISVHSKPDVGTEFILTLPINQKPFE